MEIEKTSLPGVVVVNNRVFEDDRGFFMETYNQQVFNEAGLPAEFVQDNHSRSARGVLRGLHFQFPQWQGKLVRVISGEIFDVAVDIRKDSPNYGEWVGVMLDADHHVCVRPGLHCAPLVHEDQGTVGQKGSVRIAPGYFTDEEDLQQAIEGIRDIAS